MKVRIAALVAALVAALAVTATPVNAYPFFDWAWGYPNVNQFHQNTWYVSDSVMQREQAYVQINGCLPPNAKLKLGYFDTNWNLHRVVTSAFGACRVNNLQASIGPSRVAFRIQFWNCDLDFLSRPDCSRPTSMQTGDCTWNLYPNPGCPANGGPYVNPYATYKWFRVSEGWAYTNILGCGNETQCQ